MNKSEIIEFLREDNSSAIFRHLLLNPEQKLMAVILIDGVMARLTVKKMAEYDAFTVCLYIPQEFWSVNYINFNELFPEERRPSGPPG